MILYYKSRSVLKLINSFFRQGKFKIGTVFISLSCRLQDLDEMARYARELHDAEDESGDEIVMDESPSQIIATCSNFIQEYVILLSFNFITFQAITKLYVKCTIL